MAKEDDLNLVIDYIHEKIDPNTLNSYGKSRISNLLNDFTKEELFDAIDISFENYIYLDKDGIPTNESITNFLNKIGGIAHNNSLSPIEQKLRHLKNIAKRNFSYWNEKNASIILNNYIRALRFNGWTDDMILNDLNNEAFERANECNNCTQWKSLFEGWTESLMNSDKNISDEDLDSMISIKKEYEIIKEIGSGSFGITYLCKDNRLDKLFVIKKFSCGMLDQEQNKKFFDKFIIEIVSLFNLHHQNIVSIYDYIIDRDNNAGIYIMEYIDGLTIEDYLVKHKNKANCVFKQLIDAFCYLESKNICHRDIRISNILVTHDGEANLIDFGFVKNISESNSIHSSTKCIVYPYDWPEELKQKIQKYDIKTDIYFLGKLFEDLVDRLNISEFKYGKIISHMVVHYYKKRISTFSEIKSIINYIDCKEIDEKYPDLD